MNVYHEIEEVEETQERLSRMMDVILDLYKTNPKEASNLLKECQLLKEEYSELHKKFSNLQNEY